MYANELQENDWWGFLDLFMAHVLHSNLWIWNQKIFFVDILLICLTEFSMLFISRFNIQIIITAY